MVIAGITTLGLIVGRNLLQGGFPPGVDTPTFLHMAWFTRETISGAGGFQDPYWYGGIPIFTTYPPLSYGIVGVLAAIPGVGLVFTYTVALLAAYVGTGLATYYLARQLDNARSWSALAAMLTMLAYPVHVTVGLWGWYSSIVALPLALMALAMLERSFRYGRGRWAIAGGVFLGLSVLAHHMTAFAFALWLPGWVVFYYVRQPDRRRDLNKTFWLFTGATAAVTVWWIIPWAVNLAAAGFQREIPGLWSFPLAEYLNAITRRDLIGLYAYPTYLGIGLILMAVGGVIQGLLSPSRSTPYAVLLVVLVAISLSEQVNPLIRMRPLDGLDVARFQLYMVPIIAVVGLPFLATVGIALVGLVRLRNTPVWLPPAISGLFVALILGQALWDGAVSSQRLFKPYHVTREAQLALEWLGSEEHRGKVLGVGFWHWDDFLLPYMFNQPVVDGWHDEGTKNWRTVRVLRMMMWSGKVDIPQAHALLGELDGRYIAVQDYFSGESPEQFRAALKLRPDLFSQVSDWGEVTIFERLSQE